MADSTPAPVPSPASPGPSIPPQSEPSKVGQGLTDYALKNPFIVMWNFALIIGGLITFMQFLGIRYFPDIDLKSAASLLVGIALLGCFFIFVLALTMVVPSYLLRQQIWINCFLYCRRDPGAAATRVSPAVETKRRLVFMFQSAFYGSLGFSTAVGIFAFLLEPRDQDYAVQLQLWMVAQATASILAAIAMYAFLKKKDASIIDEAEKWGGHGLLTQHGNQIFIWVVMFGSFIFMLAIAAAGLRKDDLAGHLALLAFGAVYISVNSWLATVDLSVKKNYWKFPAGAVALVIAYLCIPTNTLNISKSVFASFSLGNTGATRFVVKRPTCDALNVLKPNACQVVSEFSGCVLPKNLSNRLGADYLLEFAVEESKNEKKYPESDQSHRASGSTVRMVVPKSEVLAWSMLDGRQSTDASCIEAPKASKPTSDNHSK